VLRDQSSRATLHTHRDVCAADAGLPQSPGCRDHRAERVGFCSTAIGVTRDPLRISQSAERQQAPDRAGRPRPASGLLLRRRSSAWPASRSLSPSCRRSADLSFGDLPLLRRRRRRLFLCHDCDRGVVLAEGGLWPTLASSWPHSGSLLVPPRRRSIGRRLRGSLITGSKRLGGSGPTRAAGRGPLPESFQSSSVGAHLASGDAAGSSAEQPSRSGQAEKRVPNSPSWRPWRSAYRRGLLPLTR